MIYTLRETEEYNGYNINIHYDHDIESPRTAFDNLGKLYTRHRNYQPEEKFDSHFEMEDVFENDCYDFKDEFLKQYIALRVYMYSHSGDTVRTSPFSCRWDSGLFGIIAVHVEDVKKEYGWKYITKKRREKIEKYLEGEVEIYDDYLTGSVYGYTITDNKNNELNSCWGYYGNDCIEEIKNECRVIIDNFSVAA